uniref:Putative glycine-rich cell wall structural protein n=1 Tax=Amblyomma parvum TaxID=251391 RepID=A0A023FTW8_AMBPA
MRTTAILLLLCLAGVYGQKGGIQGQTQIGSTGGSIDIGGGSGGGGTGGGIGGGSEGITGGGGGVGGSSGGVGGSSGGIGGGVSGGFGGISGGGSIGGGIGGGSQGGLDLFTLLARQIILAYGMDPLRLPNLNLPFKGILGKAGSVQTFNTLVFGLSHVRRTGPCFVTVDETGMKVGLDLGIRNVIANSSAKLQFKSRRLSRTQIQVMATVKRARAVMLISQTGPHEIHVRDFKMLKLDGFKLYIRPVGKVSPLVRPFLGAARKFLEIAVHRRLEKMVRHAVDSQIKNVLAFLQRQAQSRPQPQLPSIPTESGGGIGGGFGGGIGGGVGGGVGGGIGGGQSEIGMGQTETGGSQGGIGGSSGGASGGMQGGQTQGQVSVKGA